MIGFLLLPAAEIAAFVLVGSAIGWLAAFALFFATTLSGVLILRGIGTQEVTPLRGAFARREFTAISIDGPRVLAAIGALFLILPGFITDALGAILLLFTIPSLFQWVVATFGRGIAGHGPRAQDEGVVDLDRDQWERVPERRLRHRRPDDRDTDDRRYRG